MYTASRLTYLHMPDKDTYCSKLSRFDRLSLGTSELSQLVRDIDAVEVFQFVERRLTLLLSSARVTISIDQRVPTFAPPPIPTLVR